MTTKLPNWLALRAACLADAQRRAARTRLDPAPRQIATDAAIPEPVNDPDRPARAEFAVVRRYIRR